jgi:hypothetical protein
MEARPLGSKTFYAGVSACLAASLLAAPSPARAQTGAEAKCRSAIAKSMGKYVKTLQKAVLKCHKRRNKGSIAPATDCSDPLAADAAANKDKAAATLAKAVDAMGSAACQSSPAVLTEFARCPAPFETADDGGATSGIDDFGELSTCLSLHAVKLVQDAADELLGTPTLPLDKDQQKCHATIGKVYSKIVDTMVKERAKCQKKLDKSGGGLGFACATADPKGKIAAAREKGKAKIASKCAPVENAALTLGRAAFPRAVGDLDSCAEDVNGLVTCVVGAVTDAAGGGAAAMLWELPGICPGNGSYQVVPVATDTEVDTGWTGNVHDMDPILGYKGVTFTITCDADCANCVSTSVDPSADACRCSGDASVQCAADLDCGGVGGACDCFYGPPAPYIASGNPVCVVTQIAGSMSGGLDPVTGDVSLTIPALLRIYNGFNYNAPCPHCTGGLCEGGARNGLSCSVDATDATFGTVSYDCPPDPLSNLTGFGITTTAHFTTGTLSLPFALPCDAPLSAFDCACAVCSGDTSIACNSDTVCSAASAGTCSSHGAGVARYPNLCNDLVCSPDPGDGPNEGTCLAGPVDHFCDGWLRSNGEGLIYCIANVDCDAYGPVCPDGNCGSCTLSKNRDCFLDPIVAEGVPAKTLVGEGCIGPTGNAGINGAVGWPGAYRVRQNLAADLLCSDGVTPYYPPGGSNCP